MSSTNGTQQNDCTTLGAGEIRFYDNYVPTLPVGDYLINVTQRINPVDSGIDECHPASQMFSVQGPRYTLPTEDVFSTFPPNNAEGIFNQSIPHVVLGKREIPWERNVFNDPDPARQTPWLALLLFVDGEKIGGKDALLAPAVSGWRTNRTMTASLRAYDFYHHATGDGILWPALEPEWYESDEFLTATNCSVIDISPEAFTTLIPSPADLPYLAHVRQVDPTAKESEILKINGEGWYSIITGNRLPDAPPAGSGQPGRRNIAHLVSLEGFQDYIDGTAHFPDTITRIRMISLQSWTFSCLPQMGESFAEAMNGLLRDARGEQKPTAFKLPIPAPADPTPEETFAYGAIQNGYIPLRYHTRLGEQSFGWFRGPFSPVPVKNFVSSKQQSSSDPVTFQSFGTASAAIVYDKDHGIFDPSYGVAWETGRLMALSDPIFGPKLREWHQRGHYLVDMIIERQHQMAALNGRRTLRLAAPTSADALVDLTEPRALTDGLMTRMILDLSDRIIAKLSRPPKPLMTANDGANPSPMQDTPTVAFADRLSPDPTPSMMENLFSDRPPLRAMTADLGNAAPAAPFGPMMREAVRSQGTSMLDELVNWLSKLYLLNGVPFENLVPHAELLTEESVRFFYVDSNWLDVMMEGALSIGIESSRDIFYQKLMMDLVQKGTLAAAQGERRALLGSFAPALAPNAPPFNQETMTGLLLRSSVVSGWPGLEIHAYARTKPGTAQPDLNSEIHLLRMERLSADVMLCLWPSVPAVVTIDEPHEGVAFGFEDPPAGQGNGYFLYLRSLNPKDYGKPLPEATYRIDASKGIIGPDRRIKISGSGGLLEAMRNLLPGSPTINIRDFAVQMVKVPETAIFATPQAREIHA